MIKIQGKCSGGVKKKTVWLRDCNIFSGFETSTQHIMYVFVCIFRERATNLSVHRLCQQINRALSRATPIKKHRHRHRRRKKVKMLQKYVNSNKKGKQRATRPASPLTQAIGKCENTPPLIVNSMYSPSQLYGLSGPEKIPTGGPSTTNGAELYLPPKAWM